MGNFRSGSRGGFGGRSGGSRFGGRDRGGFGGRDSGRFRRRPPEMHDVTCDKCKKPCQVPFRPTGDKPVLCSDCFRSEGSGGSRGRGGSSASGMSSEQFSKINTKLDKIIKVLENFEVEAKDDLGKDLVESLGEDEKVPENKSETEPKIE